MPLFSQTAEYALRAVAHLATQSDFTSTIPEMAAATQVTAPYLRKVLVKLREADIVQTQRGTGGGVRLLCKPNKLTLLEVINAVDPVARIERCPLGIADHKHLCPMHSELDQALAEIEKVLSRRTLADILAKPRRAGTCGFPGRLT